MGQLNELNPLNQPSQPGLQIFNQLLFKTPEQSNLLANLSRLSAVPLLPDLLFLNKQDRKPVLPPNLSYLNKLDLKPVISLRDAQLHNLPSLNNNDLSSVIFLSVVQHNSLPFLSEQYF